MFGMRKNLIMKANNTHAPHLAKKISPLKQTLVIALKRLNLEGRRENVCVYRFAERERERMKMTNGWRGEAGQK